MAHCLDGTAYIFVGDVERVCMLRNVVIDRAYGRCRTLIKDGSVSKSRTYFICRPPDPSFIIFIVSLFGLDMLFLDHYFSG